MKNEILQARSIDEIWSSYEGYRDNCEFIKVGIEEIDKALNGGLPLGKIFEIYGSSGSGKTQFALSIISEILIKNGLYSSEVFSLYLYTNGTFPIQRLCEIVESKRRDHMNVIRERKCSIKTTDLLNYLLIDKVGNSTELYEVLTRKFLSLLRANVKLLVIDSIASIYRFSSREERQPDEKPMIDVVSILKQLAHEHNLAVLVINQATTTPNTYYAPFVNPRSNVRPALGDMWTKCINGRILLWIDRKEGWRDKNRHFQIIFSSNAPTSSPIPFIITKRGIEIGDCIAVFHDQLM